MDRKPRCVGIDLGTTYSTIAYLDDNGRAVTVPNRRGDLLTPSVVLYEKGGTAVVGLDAKEAAPFEPERVVECVKRDMGEDRLSRPVPGLDLTPQEVSAVILRRLAQDFEKEVGPISEAVITVPAFFDDTRRKATRDAGQIAGLNVAAVLNEPVAAALAYSLKDVLAKAAGKRTRTEVLKELLAPHTALVFDLGGGTFDVTVVRCDGTRIETVVTDGSVRLGGKDWDDRVVAYLVELFRGEHGVDARKDPLAMADLRVAAERAKQTLSTRAATPIRVQVAGKRISKQLDREKFEDITADLLAQTQLTAELIIEEAQLSWSDIDKVLLVGGSTRMPMIARMLHEVTGEQPDSSLPADLAVAQGAAIYAAILSAKRARQQEPSVEVEKLPFEGEVLTTLDEIQVQHVNSHSFGVVARNRAGQKINAILIRKNTPIPHAAGKTFGLEMHGQTTVRVTILEGEAKDPTACTRVGECVVSDLPEGLPRGAPIKVTCRYDVDGRIHVEAKEMVSGKTARTEIQRQHGLSEERIDRLAESVGQLIIE